MKRQLKYILMFYSYLERVVAVSLYTLFEAKEEPQVELASKIKRRKIMGAS